MRVGQEWKTDHCRHGIKRESGRAVFLAGTTGPVLSRVIGAGSIVRLPRNSAWQCSQSHKREFMHFCV